MSRHPFVGRSLTVISDLTYHEMLYLFKQTRRLKQAIANNDLRTINEFIIQGALGIYLIFTENSTRTKNSFLAAAKFHQKFNSLLAVHVFDAATSSFAKQESWQDTINNLMGYFNRVFIIRSRLEGVCRWLRISASQYAQRHNYPQPIFINAGDGKHEHPTQELLDEFSFFEDNHWRRGRIHVALIGDLLHGRTAHSKVNGLKFFQQVKVDLVAPSEIQMPQHYIEQMRANGFQVRLFGSIEDYLNQTHDDIADKWYFTRPQLERLGEHLKPLIEQLRQKIIFHQHFLECIKKPIKVYHPLPRYKPAPSIPLWLDNHPFNAYEKQSINGYYTRIVLLSLLLGRLGHDFKGQAWQPPVYSEDFIEYRQPQAPQPKPINEGINPIKHGVVIDHISQGEEPQVISQDINRICRVMDFTGTWYAGVAYSRKTNQPKGIIFLPHYQISTAQIKILAATAPYSTLNIIQNNRVAKKLVLSAPERIYNIQQLACKNPQCISYPSNHEGVMPDFIRQVNDQPVYICAYCGQPHTYREIWRE